MREIYAKNTNNIFVRKQIKKALCVDIILVTAQEKGNLLLNMKTLI